MNKLIWGNQELHTAEEVQPSETVKVEYEREPSSRAVITGYNRDSTAQRGKINLYVPLVFILFLSLIWESPENRVCKQNISIE